jgi:hypothetical protein
MPGPAGTDEAEHLLDDHEMALAVTGFDSD